MQIFSFGTFVITCTVDTNRRLQWLTIRHDEYGNSRTEQSITASNDLQDYCEAVGLSLLCLVCQNCKPYNKYTTNRSNGVWAYVLREFYFVTDLNDFSDEWVLEILIQFYTAVHQHVLNSNITTSTRNISKFITWMRCSVKNSVGLFCQQNTTVKRLNWQNYFKAS